MEYKEQQTGIASSHIPTVSAGEYKITATLNNTLNKDQENIIDFHVAGYNINIPQNEILAVYPPTEGKGNYAGVFSHIQFRRSTLPWEYNCYLATEAKKNQIPYIFLVLLKEEELQKEDVEIISTSSDNLKGSIEEKTKPVTILKFNSNTDLLPDLELISSLAHVRVQKHEEIKELNLPEETSILIAHRMIEPHTKYRAFVCYHVKETYNLYERIPVLQTNDASTFCLVLNEWTFETIGAELYQVDTKKLENHPYYSDLKGVTDSVIFDFADLKEEIKKEGAKNTAYSYLLKLIEDNEKFLKIKKEISNRINNFIKQNKRIFIRDDNGQYKLSKTQLAEILNDNEYRRYVDYVEDGIISIDDFEKLLDTNNNHIIEFLEYNGKTLKGILHALKMQGFKIEVPLQAKNEEIKKIINFAKVPLEHQLKAGGKMVSWYQGPFTNWKYNVNSDKIFSLMRTIDDSNTSYIPDHADHLILFNENTKMLDMSYAAAWQLGRLLIMNDNKMLQEFKKWKSALSLNKLIKEQNETTHLIKLATDHSADTLPELLSNYVAGFLQFQNFPIYYFLPHGDLSTEESCKYFKIDNFWMQSFLFGIFSAGPKLSILDFKSIVLGNENIKKVFNYEQNYYGVLLQSQTIKNWPHFIVELKDQSAQPFDFTYVTSINDSMRLYITETKFDEVEMYLKNENAHFAIDYQNQYLGKNVQIMKNDEKFSIDKIEIDTGRLAFDLLYKQPRVTFKIKY